MSGKPFPESRRGGIAGRIRCLLRFFWCRGHTTRDVAARAGVSAAALRNWHCGYTVPSQRALGLLADATSVDWLWLAVGWSAGPVLPKLRPAPEAA